jgi:hypothetical protein
VIGLHASQLSLESYSSSSSAKLDNGGGDNIVISSRHHLQSCIAILISLAHLQPAVRLLQQQEDTTASTAAASASQSALLAAVERVSGTCLHTLHPGTVVELLWAFGRMHWQPSDRWLEAAVRTICAAELHALSADKMVQSVWALAVIFAPAPSRQPAQKLKNSSTSNAADRHPRRPADRHEALKLGFDEQIGVGIVSSGHAGRDAQVLCRVLEPLLRSLQPRLAEIRGGATLATLAWALARVSISHRDTTTAASNGSTQPTDSNRSRLVQPLLRQHPEFFKRLWAACAARLPSTSAHMAVVMLWSAARLGCELPPPPPSPTPRLPRLQQLNTLKVSAEACEQDLSVLPNSTNEDAASEARTSVRHAGRQVYAADFRVTRDVAALVMLVDCAAAQLQGRGRALSATDHAAAADALARLAWVPPPDWLALEMRVIR